ncbi:hypothetical protein [Pseudooceanicola sp.]|uniref:hypothetical protein n=1 Tax=Pseudooceanicola sp. TaxID=1914328 RepID=UPI0035C69D32
MFIRTSAALAILWAVSGCAEFPDLDRAIPQSEVSGPYPALVPIDGLLAQTEDPRIEDDDPARLEARRAALKARAARLRQY